MRPICEICNQYLADYTALSMINGGMSPKHKHYLCHDCVGSGVVEIINHWKIRHSAYAMPLFFTTRWDDNEGGDDKWVPLTRQGGLFPCDAKTA